MSLVINPLDATTLEVTDAPQLIWILVRDAVKLLWRDNPKSHDIGGVIQSFRTYGFQEIPKFDSVLDGGAIKAGNGRIEALWRMEQGHYDLPRGIALHKATGSWAMPLLIGVDAESHDLARAYAIDSNNLTMMGGEYSPLDMARMWDTTAYTKMLMDLAQKHVMPVSVDTDDLDLLAAYLREAEKPTEGSGTGEKALATPPEELQKKWQVEPGQLWEIPSQTLDGGCHFLMCGDSTSTADVDRLMDGDHAQAAVTSPPYAAQRAEQYGGPKPDEYLDWWQQIQANVRHILADDGCFFVNIKAHSDEGERLLYVMELVIAMKKQWGWAFVDEFCWLKPAVPGNFHYRFRNGFEPVYQFALSAKEFKFRPDNVKHVSKDVPITQGPGHGEKNWAKFQGEGVEFFPQGQEVGLARPTNVFSFPHYEPARGHPAVFPVEVPEFFIRAYSDEGDRWIDPFVGSGSTLVAAERNSRLASGMDLKPAYIAVSLERLAECGLEPRQEHS